MKRHAAVRAVNPRFPTFPNSTIAPRILAEARVNGGMVTSVDPTDLESNQAQYLRNMRVRFDKTLRRPGYTTFGPTAPNANKVLKVVTVKDDLGNATTLRFTKAGVHKLSGGAWTAITGTLAGGDSDRISVIVLEGKFYFLNNGADEIQAINGALTTFADLGNAPRYKFGTGFYERIVGANRVNVSSVELGWSGQLNPTVWDFPTDISANSMFLVESPSDLGDHISGVYGITNYLVIPRERSIWVCTKNPQPQRPFNPYNAAPGVGTNLPYTVAVWEGGIIFADARTGTVWLYTVGERPEPIGRPNDKLFYRQLAQVGFNDAFASYDPVLNEYTVVLPIPGSGVYPAWTYNFRTKSWSYDEYPITVWSLQDFDFASGYISIDELLGTIDGLQGTIDSLSPPANQIPTRAFGMSNGTIIAETRDTPSANTDNGTSFSSDFVSKWFQLSIDDQAVGHVRIDLQFESDGEVEFFYAINGEDFGDTKSVPDPRWKAYTNKHSDQRTETFIIPLNVRCRSFAFKLKATSGRYAIVEYDVTTYGLGRSLK